MRLHRSARTPGVRDWRIRLQLLELDRRDMPAVAISPAPNLMAAALGPPMVAPSNPASGASTSTTAPTTGSSTAQGNPTPGQNPTITAFEAAPPPASSPNEVPTSTPGTTSPANNTVEVPFGLSYYGTKFVANSALTGPGASPNNPALFDQDLAGLSSFYRGTNPTLVPLDTALSIVLNGGPNSTAILTNRDSGYAEPINPPPQQPAPPPAPTRPPIKIQNVTSWGLSLTAADEPNDLTLAAVAARRRQNAGVAVQEAAAQ